MASGTGARNPISCEAQVFELLSRGLASDEVLHILLPENAALAYESDLWD